MPRDYQKYKGWYRQYKSEYDEKIRNEVIELLGGKCCKCGYQGLALQIDHINNGGTKEFKEFKNNTVKYLKHVIVSIKNGLNEYQLLCANCNWEKELERRKMKLGGN
jgi:5-methylcytosine-specific restriction endonuclease McrA